MLIKSTPNGTTIEVPDLPALSSLIGELPGGFARNFQSPLPGFWSDIGTSPVIVDRWRGRILGGGASLYSTARAVGTGSWLASTDDGPTWIPRDAGLVYMQENSGIAVAGLARASDAGAIGGGIAPIGLAGYAKADYDARTVWAGYFEVQIESGTNRKGFGLEIDVKNRGANAISTPYGLAGGVGGVALWLTAGGDASYGGSPANPSDAAIVVLNNAHTWNSGIVFKNGALTVDGGGKAVAIKMAAKHMLEWQSAAGVIGAQVYSSVVTSGKDVSLVFQDDLALFLRAAAGGTNFRILSIASAVNYLEVRPAVTGGGPSLSAIGTDTDINLRLVPQGVGVIQVPIANVAAYADDAAAAVGGVPVGGLYRTASAMKIRAA